MGPDQELLDRLIEKTEKIITRAREEVRNRADLLSKVHPLNYESARNLIHYLTVRTFDLRDMQTQLASLGISAIGHAEAYTLANLLNIQRLLSLLAGKEPPDLSPPRMPLSLERSQARLQDHKQRLLGPERRPGHSKIMVTMPSEAADDYGLIHSLILAGMDIARINLSHDGPEAWAKMTRNVRAAEKETGRRCLVYMDLAGPKLRTEFPLGGKKREKLLKKGIRLHTGDMIKIVKGSLASIKPGAQDKHLTAVISSSLEDAFDQIETGQRIFFDDGKIGGRVVETGEAYVVVRVDQAGMTGSRLKHEKGINLPDTNLRLPSLTREDHENLPFIAQQADIVGYSFVRTASDVELLQLKLRELGRPNIGMVLKIETNETFENLPDILLTAMRSPSVGVMIARGDLAVEIGFERIAEVQEEILWLCEAAHVPGIWATQVLEKLAKKGQPSRAEVTDAAMAGRAECVMLNKGPYIVNATSTLENILQRMEEHQVKRKGSLRPLSVARAYIQNRPAEVKLLG